MKLVFLEGKQAAAQGGKISDNPYPTTGTTKLGNPILSDNAKEWEDGFRSIGRRASSIEVANAAAMHVGFRRSYRP